jgi:hypothetical protein
MHLYMRCTWSRSQAGYVRQVGGIWYAGLGLGVGGIVVVVVVVRVFEAGPALGRLRDVGRHGVGAHAADLDAAPGDHVEAAHRYRGRHRRYRVAAD